MYPGRHSASGDVHHQARVGQEMLTVVVKPQAGGDVAPGGDEVGGRLAQMCV